MLRVTALKILALAVVFCSQALLPAAAATEAPLLRTQNGQSLSARELAKETAGYDVVVLGEFHNSQEIHRTELAVLQALYKEHGRRTVLSLEMFERDVQPELDQYLAGRQTEEEFLQKSRPWPNYDQAYRPLVAFAKGKKLPVLASNIPRRIAAVYAKTDSLQAVPSQDQVYLPAVHKAGSALYEQKFTAVMQQMDGTNGTMKVPPERIHSMYMAQCLKDDTMAETIAFYKKIHPEALIFHVTGNFHSESHLGLVEKLQALQPELKIAVIDAVHTRAGDDLQKLAKDCTAEGEYIIPVPGEDKS